MANLIRLHSGLGAKDANRLVQDVESSGQGRVIKEDVVGTEAWGLQAALAEFGGRVELRRVGSPAAFETEPQSAPATPAQPAQNDPTEMLRKLGELRDAGVLTDAEFEAKKTELLNRI